VEEALFGFTYIVGPPGTRRLQSQLQSGLNRKSHLIRKQPIGVSASEVSREEVWAVENAWTVVVIATPAFCRSVRGKELMRKRDQKRWGVITLWKKRPKPGEAYPWSSKVHLDLPPQPNQDVIDNLIEQVSKWIHRIEMVYSTNRTRGPDGRPGLFAMLSYSRKGNVKLATNVREQLEREHVTVWDYGDAPRKQTNYQDKLAYQDELVAKIKDARVVIFLLSKAWLQSKDCQWEARQAAQLDKRRLWLLCDDSPRPEDADPADCPDLRPRHRKKTLQQLAHKIFPSRRKKQKPA
jgi:hypothetical protein